MGKREDDFKKYWNPVGAFSMKPGVSDTQKRIAQSFTAHCVRPIKRWVEVDIVGVDKKIDELVASGCTVKKIGKGSLTTQKRIHYLKPRA